MRPILFEIFNVPFAAWYVFFAIAALGGFLLARCLLKDDEVLSHHLPWLFTVCYLSGWLGARLLSILTEEPPLTSTADVFVRWFSLGSMSFFGGVIGGVAGGLIYVRARSLPLWPIVDAAMPGMAVGLALGRLGCFFNGCDYGRPLPSGATAWWAPPVTLLGDGLPRYPTQMEEALFATLLAAAATFLLLRKALPGGVTGLLAIAALCLHRFVNEFWRGDDRVAFAPGLSFFQVLALVLALAALVMAFRILLRHNTTRRISSRTNRRL